jgi:uncharacterized protein (DUF4415 family)
MSDTDTIEPLALTDEQLAQLGALGDGEPDTSDIPEITDAQWRHTVLFKARKEAISLRLDGDILHWLRSNHEHYQTEINNILRAKMQAELAAETSKRP